MTTTTTTTTSKRDETKQEVFLNFLFCAKKGQVKYIFCVLLFCGQQHMSLRGQRMWELDPSQQLTAIIIQTNLVGAKSNSNNNNHNRSNISDKSKSNLIRNDDIIIIISYRSWRMTITDVAITRIWWPSKQTTKNSQDRWAIIAPKLTCFSN
ncbi:uncharacterized protein LOC124459928 isoform X1 [Drosophila willistoni]|uniref:uncharacterized protein LOC124459928 isoform X1 n=1 Tax=Drosophila willistoni TaxID=7260 RepID=UPI001F084FC8|nr:uncharacterized protein LOC124459928 isoform X1 [Drosophila willistoni]